LTAHGNDLYDIAVSFAGEQRDYVDKTVSACKALGLNVFYDRDKNNAWWGADFIREQRQIYSSKTRFFVPFISSDYLAKPIPMDEFSSAMLTAVKQGDGYILPVLMGNPDIPSDLLHPHIGYLRAERYTPQQLAEELQNKVQGAEASGQQREKIGGVVEKALNFRMPSIVPVTYSKYAELDNIFDFLILQFNAGSQQLQDLGLQCHVRSRDDTIVVRVERNGSTVAGLDVRKGLQMGDDHITWSTGYSQFSSNSFNGWATPKFDKDRNEAIVEVNDIASLGRGPAEPVSTYQSFFDLLWGILVDQVER
jgi:hypothetical protein